jgi:AraC-like DNA-binding protein
MIYTEFPPSPALSRYVDCFWWMESKSGVESSHPETICPDGRVELIFNCADRFRRYHSSGIVETQPQSIVTGQISEAVTIEPTGPVRLFGIRFRPDGAYPIFRFAQSEITDKIVELGEVWGSIARSLEARVFEASTNLARVAIVERVLIENLRTDLFDHLLNRAVAKIIAVEGNISIDSVSRYAGMSGRQLERKFHTRIGLSPKGFAQIIRFQKVLRLIDHEKSPRWAGIAVDCGFFDQSHLIRDFSRFSGRDPAGFLGHSREIAKHLTRAERMSDFYNT